ncbi:MAG: CapA family protein [Betaproteobacteria bacterium]|nr:CapA family protein [Betaproteobacteria bacterium]
MSLLAAGDCGPVHGAKDGFPIERYTELVRPVLAKADLRFVNCMRTYSARGAYSELAPQVRQPPEMAKIFTDCGFDAVTIANNHIYDCGPDALLDTRALLLEKGMRVTGAGRDLTEARQPAVVERNGIRVGYLGYCSVAPQGSEAGPGKPGIAPLRVKACYETRGPHASVRIRTEPDERDLEMLLEDIAALRRQVDIVIPALHYGVIRLPRIISDYQVTVAHACIDAGADMVVGHSPHIPKAIEVYKGKAIFYSLGVFCMTKPFESPTWEEAPWAHGAVRNHTDQDPEYPFMPYGKDAKRSLLAKAVLSKEGVKRVSFLPMMMDKQYRTEVLRNGDPRFSDMLRYMQWVSEGFDHEFTVDGDEVVVTS